MRCAKPDGTVRISVGGSVLSDAYCPTRYPTANAVKPGSVPMEPSEGLFRRSDSIILPPCCEGSFFEPGPAEDLKSEARATGEGHGDLLG